MARELIRSTDKKLRPRVMNTLDRKIARMKQQLTEKELCAFRVRMHLNHGIAS